MKIYWLSVVYGLLPFILKHQLSKDVPSFPLLTLSPKTIFLKSTKSFPFPKALIAFCHEKKFFAPNLNFKEPWGFDFQIFLCGAFNFNTSSPIILTKKTLFITFCLKFSCESPVQSLLLLKWKFITNYVIRIWW